jgi:hypothetical protein
MEKRIHKVAVAETPTALSSQGRAVAKSTFRAIGGGIAGAEFAHA